MNETKRRAIVWDRIERIAFRPLNSDRETWLGVYARTLRKFWGMGSGMGLKTHLKSNMPVNETQQR